MKRHRQFALVITSTFIAGCAAPCADDGLLQERCPSVADDGSGDADSTDGDSRGDATLASASMSGSADDSGGMSNSAEGSSATASDSDEADGSTSASATNDTAGDPWCVDADGDGYGDPTMCDDEPGPGTVDNGDDCDDTDPDVHPGAAANDESLCTQDADGDGYGDARPGPGIDPGTDCWDANPGLNPGSTMLGTVDSMLLDEMLVRVDPETAALDSVAPFESLLASWAVTTTALRADGSLYVNDTDSDRLYRVQPSLLCLGELTIIDIDFLPESHEAASICGMAFVGDGSLWAIDGDDDMLLEIDPETGEQLSAVEIVIGESRLDVGGCGVAWDCAGDRLLLANGEDGVIYSVDVETGAVTSLAETSVIAPAAGLEHDVVTGHALLAANARLYEVEIDGSNDMSAVGIFDYGLLSGPILIDDLGTFPMCDP